ncbi:TlpA family protein disulfide reductase [Natronobacterium texcoconense]|uniref:AhpC/TSA family protein n=1 Tax=Natronobacterium texcoconense TaxID=1095778 RepID=A0A1H1A864_NATTX|nr:TlpA disulfide reductase family protein [Natronobacterium texcoconense]SDQ35770.1 AhpC/TSA family protein [Natronobacterium texcoconense]
MNRRELVAGVASLGVLGGGLVALQRGVPFQDGDSAGAENTDEEEGDDDGPIEIETIEARGSEAGTLDVPNDGITFVTFFSPVCHRCRSLMPNLVEAQERLADEDGLTRVSVTTQQSPEQLRDWWEEHDGHWTLAHDDDRTLSDEYEVVSHPVLLAIDPDGIVRWEDEGVLEADRIVRRVESVLEEHLENDVETDDEETNDGNETD